MKNKNLSSRLKAATKGKHWYWECYFSLKEKFISHCVVRHKNINY